MKRKLIRRKKKRRLIKRPAKLLPRGIITCRYCRYYTHSEALKEGRRCCATKQKIISSDTACSKFKKNKYINCDKDIAWVAIEACVNRRKMKQAQCKRCRQFEKEIDYLIQKRKLKHYVRKLKHKKPKQKESILIKGRKKRKRSLKIRKQDAREATIHIGKAMFKHFGKLPWMNQYPEIFKKNRRLKHRRGGVKWQGKERRLIHKTM